jgi:exosortase
MHTQILSAASLLVALPGLSLLFLGWARTKVLLFPFLFLAFALPVPLGITESLHLGLRELTVWIGTPLLPFLGINVYVEGTTLHTTRGPLVVADACSGFSTLYAAMAVACLAAYTATNWPRRTLVLVAAAPIAIAANVLRVVFLVAMVVWQGEEILHTAWHPLSGLATFALALPLIFWLGGPPPAKEPRS